MSTDSSPFSSENIFQTQTKSGRRVKRKNNEAVKTQESTSSSPNRRQTRSSHHAKPSAATESPTDNVVRSNKLIRQRRAANAKVLISKKPALNDYTLKDAKELRQNSPDLIAHTYPAISASESLEPGEEFSPDQLLEDEDKLSNGRRNGSFLSLKLFILISLVIAGGLFINWRTKKLSAGYCLNGVERDDSLHLWQKIIAPQCVLCPAFAKCFPSFIAICEKDHLKVENPFSLGGMIPLAPICAADRQRTKRIHVLVNAIDNDLSQQNSIYLCEGKTSDPYILATDCYNRIYSRKSPNISDEEFDELWAESLKQIIKRSHIHVIEKGNALFLASSSTKMVPIYCALRIYMWRLLQFVALPLFSTILILTVFVLIGAKIRKNASEKQKIRNLFDVTMQYLKEQRQYSERNKDIVPYVSIPQLRDTLLADEINIIKRQSTWEKVQLLLANNANIRIREIELNGEWHSVLEYLPSFGIL